MRLSQIEIENFKGVNGKQVIDLKPITLLFGPNSAGKSTILQALHYVREILERRNLDPDQTIAGGLIDLGGFTTLVHGHDLSRAISVKVRIDLRDDQGSEDLPLNSGGELENPRFSSLPIRYLVGENTALEENAIVQEVGVGLQIRWSELAQAPYVSKVEIEMDGAPLAEMISPPQHGRAELTAINYSHPLLLPIQKEDEEDTAPVPLAELRLWLKRANPLATPLGRELSDLRRERSDPEESARSFDIRIAVDTPFGALPDLDRPLRLDLADIDMHLYGRRYFPDGVLQRSYTAGGSLAADEYEDEVRRRDAVSELLDELVLGPLRIVREHLKHLTYIGPLREIPSRTYRPQRSPGESRWATGLAAWDLLYTDQPGKLLGEVNSWLSGEDRLRTRYQVDRTQYKEIEVGSRIHQIFDRGLNEEDIAELQELYSALGTRTEIALRDVGSGLVVSPGDVGVGISQMVPVVVACLRSGEGILAIEQPELHLHPAVQVGLGELFIRAIQLGENDVGVGKALLVETHSEHIMLRLLRRIRETSEGELPPGVMGLSPEQLSVIYVDSDDSGTCFKPLRVSEDGDFIDRWPSGFFEERSAELF